MISKDWHTYHLCWNVFPPSGYITQGFWGQSFFQCSSWLQLRHRSLDQCFDDGPLGNAVQKAYVLFWVSGLGSCCSCRAISLVDFCLRSCSRVLLKRSSIVMSLVRPMASHPIFCIFIDLLISGDNPFTRRASRAAWVTLPIFWNPGCQKKRASKGP